MSKEKEFRIETIDKTIRMLNNIKSRILDFQGKSPISYIDSKKAELEKVKERIKQGEKEK